MSRLSTPQKELLAEINLNGVLYIRRYSRYHRTAKALLKKGRIAIVEPDHSTLGQDGYACVSDGHVGRRQSNGTWLCHDRCPAHCPDCANTGIVMVEFAHGIQQQDCQHPFHEAKTDA